MKKVLILDDSPLSREFIKQKLTDNLIEVIVAPDNQSSYTKLITILPNLVIMDMQEDNLEELAFLERKGNDNNTQPIPVIVTGPKQNRTNIAALAKYGVVKYFDKPIQFDILFEAIGNILHTPLPMDDTPCVLDLHRNGDIILVELAQGLNREKLSLLQYKLTEMIENQQIDSPKVIIMLTNLELSFVDGYNLEFLIDNVLACPKVRNKNVKILSFSPFVKELLNGHPNYSEIEMTSNLPKVMASLVDTSLTSSIPDLITNRILTPSNQADADEGSAIDTRFSSDLPAAAAADKENEGSVLSIAIIDSNAASTEATKNAFYSAGFKCTCFSTGRSFMDAYQADSFNLIITDLFLSDNYTLQILQNLKKLNSKTPVIIYAPVPQKEPLIKALALGAKTFILKPQRPNILVQKSLSIIKGEK